MNDFHGCFYSIAENACKPQQRVKPKSHSNMKRRHKTFFRGIKKNKSDKRSAFTFPMKMKKEYIQTYRKRIIYIYKAEENKNRNRNGEVHVSLFFILYLHSCHFFFNLLTVSSRTSWLFYACSSLSLPFIFVIQSIPPSSDTYTFVCAIHTHKLTKKKFVPYNLERFL